MGFQHVPPIVRSAAGRKGGRLKINKGLGAMPPEKRKAIASMGGKARYENRSSESPKQRQEGGSGLDTPVVADILGDIDESLQE